MAKPKTRPSATPSRKTAAELIAAKAAESIDMPSADALAQLEIVFKHNDSVSGNSARVGAEAACTMLVGYGWKGTRAKLNRVCRALGRKSFGTP